MRVTLLVLATVNVALAVAAVWLFELRGEPQLVGNTNVNPGQMAAALGCMVALATTIVGLVAMVRRRQVGWLSSLIVAWLIAAAGAYIAIFVIQPWQYYLVSDPCAYYPNCAPPPPYWLPWPFLAAPLLVGLVVLLYLFHMRAPGAATR